MINELDFFVAQAYNRRCSQYATTKSRRWKMAMQNKIYITVPEMFKMLGVSLGYAYKIIEILMRSWKKPATLFLPEKCRKAILKSIGWLQRLRRNKIESGKDKRQANGWFSTDIRIGWETVRNLQDEFLTLRGRRKKGQLILWCRCMRISIRDLRRGR